MAISVLDVRDTVASPYLRTPRTADATSQADAGQALRRVPVPALVAGLVAIVQAVGLLAAGLDGIDDVLASATRPAGLLILGGLLALAAWIVLAAGGGAAMIDGCNRRLLVLTSSVELFVVALVGAVAVVWPVPEALTFGLPVPVAFAGAVAVPVAKLLLADAPTARRWVAQGPRLRTRRPGPDPVVVHRVLCTATLGVIALGLGAVALLSPVQPGAENPASSVVYHP
ncbi:hypothetical protein DQ244_02515 [Blastococcus sp. TBT05-19]|uniref:hypothetical protein n=1 Tax=Blastococcus sp. TBT05-19 TaxID=2250581 RepID=UPI000DE9C310|nr:hypothetical protein [Blastococcus sp. TBT05-19]RBY94236.1 hypothetical protein DQ244_02515 [Blastococcus sp. TBT05-19]